jgi:hypothetical protein
MAGTGWVAPNPSAQAFSMFCTLPVHPKMAVLFFQGVPVDMAYLWVRSLLVPFSAETSELHMLQFLTAAVTHEGDNHGASCIIQTNWKHIYPGATEELQGWYFELLAQRARLPSQPEPITVALPGAPMGTAPPISPDSVIQLANLLGVHYHPPAPTKMVPATPAEKYNQYEIIILAGLCGLQGHPKTWRDLQVEALPDFWVQIRSMQNSHL